MQAISVFKFGFFKPLSIGQPVQLYFRYFELFFFLFVNVLWLSQVCVGASGPHQSYFEATRRECFVSWSRRQWQTVSLPPGGSYCRFPCLPAGDLKELWFTWMAWRHQGQEYTDSVIKPCASCHQFMLYLFVFRRCWRVQDVIWNPQCSC